MPGMTGPPRVHHPHSLLAAAASRHGLRTIADRGDLALTCFGHRVAVYLRPAADGTPWWWLHAPDHPPEQVSALGHEDTVAARARKRVDQARHHARRHLVRPPSSTSPH